MEFKSKVEHLIAKQDLCEQCRSLMRCDYCPTEACFEVKYLDENLAADFLVITKWQLVGGGLSPSEAHWDSHFHKCKTPWLYPQDYGL